MKPFFNVTSEAGAVRAIAGYRDDEDELQLAVDVTMADARAEQAFAVAYQWYADEINRALNESTRQEDDQ